MGARGHMEGLRVFPDCGMFISHADRILEWERRTY